MGAATLKLNRREHRPKDNKMTETITLTNQMAFEENKIAEGAAKARAEAQRQYVGIIERADEPLLDDLESLIEIRKVLGLSRADVAADIAANKKYLRNQSAIQSEAVLAALRAKGDAEKAAACDEMVKLIGDTLKGERFEEARDVFQGFMDRYNARQRSVPEERRAEVSSLFDQFLKVRERHNSAMGEFTSAEATNYRATSEMAYIEKSCPRIFTKI